MRKPHIMSDEEIADELARVKRCFDEMMSDEEFEGYGGSPGEWMVERMHELEHEQRRRAEDKDRP